MASYLVLTAPGGPDKDHNSTRFIADKFSWLAFIAPLVWLIWHRLWLAGLVVFFLQIAAGRMAVHADLALIGYLLGFGISLLVALEGRNLLASMLAAKGWTLDRIVSAPDLSAAEELYFQTLPETAPVSTQRPVMPLSSTAQGFHSSGWRGQAPGLFDHDGGR